MYASVREIALIESKLAAVCLMPNDIQPNVGEMEDPPPKARRPTLSLAGCWMVFTRRWRRGKYCRAARAIRLTL